MHASLPDLPPCAGLRKLWRRRLRVFRPSTGGLWAPQCVQGPASPALEMRGVDSNQSQAILRHFAAAPREPGEASLGPLRC